MGTIYIIRNKVNDKVYVGQTTMKLEDRWSAHLNHYAVFERSGKEPTKLKYAMRKYGVGEFYIEVLQECDDSVLDDLEIEYIRRFDSKENGYNMSSGGCGGSRGFKWSDESRKKLSASISGEKNCKFGKPLSEETKLKLSQALSGDSNPFYGKTHSDETRAKISAMRKAHITSEETRNKHRINMTGKNNHRYGVKPNQNTTKKISEANSQKVTIEGITYVSMKDACKQLDTSYPTIHKYLRGEIDRISVDYEGVTYTSVNTLAKHLGLPIVKVCGMIGRGRWK